MRSGLSVFFVREDGTFNPEQLCSATKVGLDQMIYGDSFHGITTPTNHFGCDTWEDGITPKITINIFGCSHNGEYHLIAFDYKNGNFENKLGDESQSFKSLFLLLFLVEGPPPHKNRYSGYETILSLSLDIMYNVYEIPCKIVTQLDPTWHHLSLVHGGKKGLLTKILTHKHAIKAERSKIFSLYGVEDHKDHDFPETEKLFRIYEVDGIEIIQSLDSDVYHRWQGLLCDDKYSPLVHFRIRPYPTDFHVLAWEKKRANLRASFRTFYQVVLYVTQGNNQELLRTYNDTDKILRVSISYSLETKVDIAIHDIYLKSITGIQFGGYTDGRKISHDTYNDVEIREVTTKERDELRKMFPQLFTPTQSISQPKQIQTNKAKNWTEPPLILEIDESLDANASKEDRHFTFSVEPFTFNSKYWGEGRYLCIGFMSRNISFKEKNTLKFHLLLTTIPPSSRNRLAVDFIVHAPAQVNKKLHDMHFIPPQPVCFNGVDELIDVENNIWIVKSFVERIALTPLENGLIDDYCRLILKTPDSGLTDNSKIKEGTVVKPKSGRQNVSWSDETKREVADFYCSYRRNHIGIGKTINVFNEFRKAKPKSAIATLAAFKKCVATCKKTRKEDNTLYIGPFYKKKKTARK